MQLPYSEKLDIAHLSRIFDNKSECYKLFWFQAIVNKAADGKSHLTFDELINEMVADAWYMVTEYRLNLGPADTLEALVHQVHHISGMHSNEKKEQVVKYMENCEDKVVINMKKTLTKNVPYRLQAPFLDELKGTEWNISEKELARRINDYKRLIYYFNETAGLKREIYIQPIWQDYIIQNRAILKGWIEYNIIDYLQKRNPSVPGIINKLSAPQERKLEKAKKFWKAVAEVTEIKDIYGNVPLTAKDISIDHFVPWSYVAHDEMWNLNPTTKSINSSKSNNLPNWDIYFPALCVVEYTGYEQIWDKPQIREIFAQCEREHVNTDEARMKLYRKGISKTEFSNNLEQIVRPVYEAAERMGFGAWELER